MKANVRCRSIAARTHSTGSNPRSSHHRIIEKITLPIAVASSSRSCSFRVLVGAARDARELAEVDAETHDDALDRELLGPPDLAAEIAQVVQVVEGPHGASSPKGMSGNADRRSARQRSTIAVSFHILLRPLGCGSTIALTPWRAILVGMSTW